MSERSFASFPNIIQSAHVFALLLLMFTTSLSRAAPGVVAGEFHTCAINSAGGVQCWGRAVQLGDGTTTERSTPTDVIGLSSDVVAIAAGTSHTCALTIAGAVFCWGSNITGLLGDGTSTSRSTPVAVSGLNSNVAAIAAGQNHTCAVTSAGGVYCWGSNTYGQLGDNTTDSRNTPVAVIGLSSGVVAIGVGDNHSCALVSSGAVQCWGRNNQGQLGDNSRTTRLTPALVSGTTSAVKITVGSQHTCSLDNAGGVYCWGYNGHGQIGDNGSTLTDRLTPVPVSGLTSGVVAIDAGDSHSCALTNSGSVLCWGANDKGQLGDESATNRRAPVLVSGLGSGVVAITTGGDHSCALTNAGSVQCWGYNVFSQLGNNSPAERRTPVTVTSLAPDVVAIAARNYHSCVLNAVGGVHCWGDNTYGQLGDGSVKQRLLPVAVSGLNTNVTAVAVGEYHTCAIKSGGSPYCWGRNNDGQLGDNSQTDRYAPTLITGLPSVESIAPGNYHTCALTHAGVVYCWGQNAQGQLGDGTNTERLSPIAVSGIGSDVVAITAGDFHTCALANTGTLFCWGDNDSGQLGDNSTIEGVTPAAVNGLPANLQAISAGSGHTCALTSTGDVYCWGDNRAGQLGDGTTVDRLMPVTVSGLPSGIVAIAAAGDYQTCALTNVGGVYCWGANGVGELGDGTTAIRRETPVPVNGLSSGVVAIVEGDDHACALMNTGVVKCWGSNQFGQMGDGSASRVQTPVAVKGPGGVGYFNVNGSEPAAIEKDVPLPGWALVLLASSLMATFMRRQASVRKCVSSD